MTTGASVRSGVDSIVEYVAERAGLAFASEPRESIEIAVRKEMASARTEEPGEYLELLRASGPAWDALIDELTVRETYLFRDPSHFDFLRESWLPEIRREGFAAREIRVWSAGCSSGEEAYSLAILFEEEGVAETAHILATDISQAALARAREARYRAWSLRAAPEPLVKRYFQQSGEAWTLADRIRRRVVLASLNLAEDAYPSHARGIWGMDLILCRNVLIYFSRDVIRRVARRLFECLAVGGWLITGPSDPPLGEYAPLQTVVTRWGVFYRRVDAEAKGARVFNPRSVGEPRALSEPRSVGEPRVLSKPRALKKPAGALPSVASSSEPSQGDLARGPKPFAEVTDPLEAARGAFARGEYARAVELTRGKESDAGAWALRVRAIANLHGLGEAERACEEAAERCPLAIEIHFLRAVISMGMERDADAVAAARRAVYLDHRAPAAHFTLGTALARMGDAEGARRAFRNARALCDMLPADQVVPLSDGERAGRMSEAAAAQLRILDGKGTDL